ncbi:MAG: DUF4013 domain-containing protein [Methanobrevibacter sp.]|jgi:hypothetical protein|nr:DUF4013 domain-containing protein [Methanobrevibacter sp.]
MILDVFRDSFEYCTKNKKSIFKLGILNLFSFVLIPMVFLYGYLYRVIDIGVNGLINGNDPLPNFENLEKMFTQGLKVIIVDLIYTLPITIVLICFSIISSSHSPFNDINQLSNLSFANWIFIVSILSEIIIIIILLIICILFESVALVHMVKTKSIKKAFNFKEILNIIKSIGVSKYLKFYLGSISLLIGIMICMFILMIFSILIFSLLIGTIFSNLVIGFQVSSIVLTIVVMFLMILYIVPASMIFKSRASSLIYNFRETVDEE